MYIVARMVRADLIGEDNLHHLLHAHIFSFFYISILTERGQKIRLTSISFGCSLLQSTDAGCIAPLKIKLKSQT